MTEDVRKSLHECNMGNHDLVEISNTINITDSCHDVIRWCRICGAIVGDKEYDTGLRPGGKFKMMGPQVLGLAQIYYD